MTPGMSLSSVPTAFYEHIEDDATCRNDSIAPHPILVRVIAPVLVSVIVIEVLNNQDVLVSSLSKWPFTESHYE